jgi:CDP-paratose 2-epimerase
MAVAVITGSGGLIGSEASRFFADLGFDVVGIDNDMRARFFGSDASTAWNVADLQRDLQRKYRHEQLDIRDTQAIDALFAVYGNSVKLVVHTAAQPSHDWAAKDPIMDFTINANGTLALLEATRKHCSNAPFIFTSTNKVYGDRPNELPLQEQETRWEIDPKHEYATGISEGMSIDQCLHSLFGASKVAADVLVQEYGRYFGMNTVVFRGGCLTGPRHSGTQLHGFLAYLMKCTATRSPYSVFGYKGKQVRDNIHSHDLISAFYEYFKAPRPGETYNIGGGRFSNCSMIEAIAISEEIVGQPLEWSYQDQNRVGDHIWWISDISKFQNHYPEWRLTKNIRGILTELYQVGRERWTVTA